MTISVSHLSARYSRIEVCHDISFEVGEGEFLAILGMNGAGKSSLLGAIAGWVSAKGNIRVSPDQRIDHLPARQRARNGIAFVPEARRNLFTPLTVEENLQLGLRLSPRQRARARSARASTSCSQFSRRGGRLAGMLSGGEQQMLALAVAIARQPAVSAARRTLAGTGADRLEEISHSIEGLRALGLTLLLAEQNHQFASRLADRFIALQSGEIVDAGDKAALTSRDRVVAAIMRH